MVDSSPNALTGNVLVVDDSSISRRQIAQALTEVGLSVTEAMEGAEGLWRARQKPFDLVVTDIHMPTMDGLEFLSQLRLVATYQFTPVFVLTSDCTPERLQRGKALGATAWFVKPVKPSALVEAARKAILSRR